MRTLWHRLKALVRGRRLEGELNDEVDFHVAMLEREFREKGMAAGPARGAALREFGGVAQTKEAYRERRGLPWIETTARDVRYAARGLAHNRGFAAAAVLSLALGIGANTAIFSLFHALLLRRLPVKNPQELALLYRTGGWGRGYASYPLYLEVEKRTDLFNGVVARSGLDRVRFDAAGGDRLETVWREFVSGNYFSVLGVQPAAGRLFTTDDNRTPGGHPLAVLSYDFWQRRFAGDPNVVGRTVKLESTALTVIGVAAPGFHGIGVDRPADLWEPAMMKGAAVSQPGAVWAWIVARRRPEISRARAQAAVDVLYEQHRNAVWGSHGNAAFRKTAMSQRIEVRDAGLGISLLREQFGDALRVLMAAVALVLLAACANVANLLLARNAAREKEVALRFSLGATRARLVRQALTECLLLAAAGAALGIGIAYAGQHAILRFLPAASANPFSAAPDFTVLGFSLGISLLSVLLFGVAPAWRSTAVAPAAGLRPGAARGGRWQPTLRRVLVMAQVAFSVVLVALAGLFGHSLAALRAVDLGFYNQSVVVFSLDFPSWWKPEARQAAYERYLARMRELPGVALVSYSFPGPFAGGSSSRTLRVPGSPASSSEPSWIAMQAIAPRYFEALGSPVLAGREFNLNDRGSSQVAIVNQAFVRYFLGGEPKPLDRVISFDDSKPVTRIVGIVPDILHTGLREKPVPTVYVPYAQEVADGREVLARIHGPAAALLPAMRREAAQLGPQVTIGEPRTIQQRIDESIFEDRLLATLGGFFGGLALLLAAIGLYGVVAYAAVRRMGEIGIRIALGARRSTVVRMVLRDALLLVAVGLAVGLPFAAAAARAVGSMLFGVRPADPLTFVMTAAVLAFAGIAAALLPAARAASADPARVLRHE